MLWLLRSFSSFLCPSFTLLLFADFRRYFFVKSFTFDFVVGGRRDAGLVG